MIDEKSITESIYSWTFKKRKAILSRNREPVIELKSGKKGSATFEWAESLYVIRNRGFWNALTTIECQGKTLATLKRYPDKKSTIAFDDQPSYFLKIKNAVLISVSINSGDRKSIVNFRLKSKYKAVFSSITPGEEQISRDHIFLIVLGCFVFRSILKENKFTDLRDIEFLIPQYHKVEEESV